MNNEGLKEVMLRLEADINVRGWDQPSSIFVVEEVDNDPYVIKLGEFEDHPCDILDSLPPITKKSAKGLVIASEAWIVETTRELVENVNTVLDQLGIHGELRDRVFEGAIYELQGQPSMHPDRAEARFLHAMLIDGTMIMLIRRRGNDPEFQDGEYGGRLYDSMKRVFHG